MSWNWSGLNWEGRKFNCPVSLRSLGGQVDLEYPTRPRLTDGTVASKLHDAANPTSDHRPHPITGPGVVRGIDVSVTLEMGDQITEALRASKDARIKYVIWNHRSFRPPDWEWKPYDLAPHDKHFHLSTLAASDNDGRTWQLTPGDTDMDVLIKTYKGQTGAFYRALQKKTGVPAGNAEYWGSDYAGTPKPSDAEWEAAIDDFVGAVAQASVFAAPASGIDEAAVKAIINDSQIVAP